MTEDETVERRHQLNGHEFEQALCVGDGQRNLACYSPWGHGESDTTKRLNSTEILCKERWGKISMLLVFASRNTGRIHKKLTI